MSHEEQAAWWNQVKRDLARQDFKLEREFHDGFWDAIAADVPSLRPGTAPREEKSRDPQNEQVLKYILGEKPALSTRLSSLGIRSEEGLVKFANYLDERINLGGAQYFALLQLDDPTVREVRRILVQAREYQRARAARARHRTPHTSKPAGGAHKKTEGEGDEGGDGEGGSSDDGGSSDEWLKTGASGLRLRRCKVLVGFLTPAHRYRWRGQM